MKRAALIALAVMALTATFALDLQAADRPADRVVVIYFHRTERCPTCQKMGSYSEEAVKQKFADQLKDGTIEFHFVDFEKKKNAKLVKGYKVADPALIVSKIVENKVKEFKDLEEIWTKVQKKPEFLEYVQKNVAAYRK
jgi:thiol-disulfide isomerase/thioredoxin